MSLQVLDQNPQQKRIPHVAAGLKVKRRYSEVGKAVSSATEANMEEKRKRLDFILGPKAASPMDFIIDAFRSNGCDARIQISTMSDLFHTPTDDEIASYHQEVIQAVRDRDIDRLRSYVGDGRNLQCCNRFGESLMHMACRRGFTDVVKFLVLEAKCTVFVRDDYGRTAMHDAAWSPEPNFEMLEFLIEQAPELLLMSDVRGHTPFSYVRKEHWQDWIVFLQKHREKLYNSSLNGKSLLAIG
jgi:ankyrin repeat protein